jgi:H+-transporting ATPase
MKIAKGLTSKVLCTGDDGGDCWEVLGYEEIKEEIQEQDVQFSKLGYKTLGIAMAEGDHPMNFVAIVPMLDPPREDTMLTIYRIRQANIGVKMITGDHLNIAIETSRLIGLGTGILPASDLWPASHERDEIIASADGFAQVLPKDKREVILTLQKRGLIVGMTGDGVNDAPALAQAQIGIAVDGATEAARSAADIILTTPGLSAIFDAVVESRTIFARLRAYVLYRMAATIQIVVVLSVLIYGYNIVMKPLYVILLALLNDISMIPIAQDNASPSSSPEIPSMPQILLASVVYGALLTLQSVGFFEYGKQSDWLQGDDVCGGPNQCDYLSTCAYLQISIAIELIILSCRAPGFILQPKYIWGDGRPSLLLFSGVMFANILVSVLAGMGVMIYQVKWVDIGIIWIFDVCGLILIDSVKVALRCWDLPWMSAGASYGVLEYPELPAGQDMRRSGVMASVRSLIPNQQASSITSGGGMGSGMSRQVSVEKSASLLPFPHNLRASGLRYTRSFS